MKHNSRILLIVLTILLTFAFTNNSKDKFGGVALYSLRDTMATNPKEVLKEVSDIGYKYIEAAGYENGKFYGMEPEEFKDYVYELGLVPLSTHQAMVTLENADQMISEVKAAGFTYFVIPIPPMGHFTYNTETRTMNMSDDIELVTSIINTIGKKCHDAGLELLYHNHDFEFKKNKNGIIPIEYFLNNTNPKYVNFQLDLYWVTKAGADPVDYFNKFPGRFKVWHVKDMDKEGRFAPVGTGTIDFSRIFKNKEKSGMEYYFVEQDMTFDNMKPLEAIKISHEGLKELVAK